MYTSMQSAVRPFRGKHVLHLGPPAAEFSEAISKVLPSVSKAESQPILNEAVLEGRN
jgi:hypothetical protein